jgi:hypothetical protein
MPDNPAPPTVNFVWIWKIKVSEVFWLLKPFSRIDLIARASIFLTAL